MLREQVVICLRHDCSDGAVRQTLHGELAHGIGKREPLRHQKLCRHAAVELVEDLLRGGLTCIGSIERLSR